MKKLILFGMVITGLMISSCAKDHDESSDESANDAVETEVVSSEFDGSHCFLTTTENAPIMNGKDTAQRMIDSTQLSLDVKAGKIQGAFNYLPAEKDARIGTLTGTIDSLGLIKAIYSFTQEGDAYKEGMIIQLKDGKALIKMAELKTPEGGGLLEVVDNQEDFDELLSVDCKSVTFD